MWRIWGGSVLAGMLAALGQAPVGAWPFALLGYAMIAAQVGRDKSRSMICAYAAGCGHFALALNWIVQPFLVEPLVYGWMAPFALLLMAGGLALFWGLAGWCAGRFDNALNRGAAFVVALALLECARGYVFTGFPWALPGHIWIDTPIMQWASSVGQNGLTLFTLVIAFFLSRSSGPIMAALVMGALAYGGGVWRLQQPLPADTGLMVRLVQPNVAQALKWDPVQAEHSFQRLLDFTAAEPKVDLVIWPETSLPYLYEPASPAVQTIAHAAKGAKVMVGVQRLEGDSAYNSLAVLGAGGETLALYDKYHLVPFGEYLPLGDLAFRWFGLKAFAAQQGYGYRAGTGPAVLEVAGLGKMLPLICYEAVFPNEVRAAPGRADWIVQITNDAWFGTLSGPFQHAALSRLRAVEQGLPLVRVGNTGVTQMVDAHGRVRAQLDFGVTGYIDAPLPAPLPVTLYAQWGEVIWISFLSLFVIGWVFFMRFRNA